VRPRFPRARSRRPFFLGTRRGFRLLANVPGQPPRVAPTRPRAPPRPRLLTPSPLPPPPSSPEGRPITTSRVSSART
jgi:hypothetical protein